MDRFKSDEPHHCDELLERFSEYIDKELDEASATELEMHLDECEACAVKMQEFRLLLLNYRSFRLDKGGPCLSDDCRKRIRGNLHLD